MVIIINKLYYLTKWHVHFMGKTSSFVPLSSSPSAASETDEPPDSWDDEVQLPEESESDDIEEERLRDRDMEFLFQDVIRDRSLDESLKQDLQNKKCDAKYNEMLVRMIFCKVHFLHYARLFLVVWIKGSNTFCSSDISGETSIL